MIVYRIGKKNHVRELSGEGSWLYGGRWNYPGYRVLYTAESISLAILEYIIKTASLENEILDLGIAYIEIEDDASILDIKIKELPVHWNTFPAPEDLKKIGTDWLISAKSLCLRVPAVSAPDSYNILMNPQHPEIKKVNLLKVTDYHPDVRLKNK